MDEPGMYLRETTADGKTKHSRWCQAAFGRRDWRCPRCAELMLGAAPRKGWQHDYFRRRLKSVQRNLF